MLQAIFIQFIKEIEFYLNQPLENRAKNLNDQLIFESATSDLIPQCGCVYSSSAYAFDGRVTPSQPPVCKITSIFPNLLVVLLLYVITQFYL